MLRIEEEERGHSSLSLLVYFSTMTTSELSISSPTTALLKIGKGMRRRVGVAVIIISTSSIDIIGGYGGQLVDDYLLLSYLLDANVVVEWVAREVVWECVSILGGNSSVRVQTMSHGSVESSG